MVNYHEKTFRNTHVYIPGILLHLNRTV